MDKNVAGFLVKAKREIFSRNVTKNEISSRPNSTDYQYTEGDLKYIDTFIGGANFAGEEALWRDDTPFWAMNYIGRMVGDKLCENIMKEAFGFLTEALKLVPEEYPYRGPSQYGDGDYSYKCTVEGDFHWFSGVEEVFYKGNKVYELVFHGGDVSQNA